MGQVKRKRKNSLPEYTGLGCLMTRNRTKWCYGICRPIDGLGACGRLAPHSLVGRTQLAIARRLLEIAKQQETEAKNEEKPPAVEVLD